jgi:hypothetical protein
MVNVMENHQISIRMRKRGNWDLNGYVFDDKKHAIKWFNQGFCVSDKAYREEIIVEIGVRSIVECRSCGYPRREKFDVKECMTVDQFLGRP